MAKLKSERRIGLVMAEEAAKNAGPLPKGHKRMLQVQTVEKGSSASFWRAGVKHTAQPVNFGPDRFDEDQIAALFEEPKLKVALVDVPDAKDGDADKGE